MTALLIRATRVLITATILIACAPAVEHPAPGGPAFEGEEVRFVAPTGWRLQPSTAVSYGRDVRIRTYIANQPLRADCDAELVCQSPLVDGLRPGGMFIRWDTLECVAQGCDLPSGRLIPIGNRQGVRAPLDHGCGETGVTEQSGYWVTVTPQRMDVLFTCARDPSDATREAFLGFLDAIQWRVP